MSALDDIINLVESHFDVTDQDSWGIDVDKARAELSAARAAESNTIPVEAHDRVVEQMNQIVHELRATNKELLKQLDEARAELAEYRTLRPAKCRPACWRVGWNAAIKAAAEKIDPLTWYTSKGLARIIRALEPPANCGGACNPLEPDAPRPLSLVEIAAYHWYLADDDSEEMLGAVFDDMPVDEREQYEAALK